MRRLRQHEFRGRLVSIAFCRVLPTNFVLTIRVVALGHWYSEVSQPYICARLLRMASYHGTCLLQEPQRSVAGFTGAAHAIDFLVKSRSLLFSRLEFGRLRSTTGIPPTYI